MKSPGIKGNPINTNTEDSVRVRLGVAVLALRRASLPSWDSGLTQPGPPSQDISQGSRVEVCAGVLCSISVGSREPGAELNLTSRTGARLTADSRSGVCTGLVLLQVGSELNVKAVLLESSSRLLQHSCVELS